MKKTFSLLVILFLTVSIFAQITEKIYRFDDPTISIYDNFKILSFKNTINCGLTGEPALPYQTVKILLSPSYKAVSIEFIGEDELTINTVNQIYPQQQSRPMSLDDENQFIKSEQIYNTNSFYPTIPTGKLITSYMNGYAFALSSFTPVRYNPVSGEIKIYRKVKIRITTEKSDESEFALQNLTNREDVKTQIASFAQNPEIVDEYISQKFGLEDYEMLIITSEDYFTNFDNLINFYLLRGIRTTITSIEDIYTGMTGVDLQDKIRNYIIDEYQNRNIKFVLLGGDIEIVPTRGFYAYVQSGDGYEDDNIPADLYYSALDGNWNNNGNSLFGETGEEDFLPEIAVGRFSFGNAEELENMIHKTISYQTNPVYGEFNNALFAGEWLFDNPYTVGSQYLEPLIGNQTENGYETTGIPETYNIQKLYEEIEPWDAQTLMDAINSGKQYVHHVGHADYDYVAFMYNDDITDSNFLGTNGIDHNYTIFHSHGCNCGGFDVNDCILERIVGIHNFAVAAIGNSRYGWFNEGQNEGPSLHLHREMMDALYKDKLYCIGQAFMDSKIETAPWITAPGQWEEGAMKWNFYDINLLGDPSLAVWTQEPISINAIYENTIQILSTSTTVNVSINSLPAANINCVIIKDGIIHGMSISDDNGIAEIVFFREFNSIGAATLVISGNNSKPVSYPITIENTTQINSIVEAEIKVYPNPAKDFITVEIIENDSHFSKLEIYNSVGQCVLIESVNEKLNKIDISKLARGNYVIRLSNGNKTSTTGFNKE